MISVQVSSSYLFYMPHQPSVKHGEELVWKILFVNLDAEDRYTRKVSLSVQILFEFETFTLKHKKY